jgi:phospho-N-acetylmuramoyl-pentapeptide-transferase
MISMLIAAAVSFVFTVSLLPTAIRQLRKRNIGQFINEDVEGHAHKHGTPTMGGIVIVLGVIVGYFVSHISPFTAGEGFGLSWLNPTPGGLLVLFAMVGMAVIGLLDDYSKVRAERNLGLNKRGKFGGQLLIAGLFAWGAVGAGVEPSISVVRSVGMAVPPILFALWVLFMLSGFANAVNLTDGLDGLAAGSSALVFGAYTIITYWIFRNADFYGTFMALDLSAVDIARVSAAIFAAALGFLWYNAAPAQIFMGDVGSQGLGGALAAVALLTNTALLVLIIGGLFVWITATVILQVFAYRVFGRRIFKMTPIHHAFELRGWPETLIVIRFWIIAALSVAVGIGLFYADFVIHSGGVL